MTPAEAKIDIYLESMAREVWSGLGALAILDVFRSSLPSCPRSCNQSVFLSVFYETALNFLLMTLARLLEDGDKFDSLSVSRVFRYALKHPEECEWLFGAEGSRRYPAGMGEIERLQQEWGSWFKNSDLRRKVNTARNKRLAHTDRLWIDTGKVPEAFPFRDLRNALEKIGYFINELSMLTRDHEITHSSAHEEVFDHSVWFMATQECMLELMHEERRADIWKKTESLNDTRVRTLMSAIKQEYKRLSE
jgi:hypothetical protein